MNRDDFKVVEDVAGVLAFASFTVAFSEIINPLAFIVMLLSTVAFCAVYFHAQSRRVSVERKEEEEKLSEEAVDTVEGQIEKRILEKGKILKHYGMQYQKLIKLVHEKKLPQKETLEYEELEAECAFLDGKWAECGGSGLSFTLVGVLRQFSDRIEKGGGIE